MTDVLDAVRTAIGATTVHSPSACSWFGRRLPSGGRDGQCPQHSLEAHLYRAFYCQGFAARIEAAPDHRRERLTPFAEALSASNAGTGCHQPGWIVRGADDGRLVVERDGLTVWARPQELALPGGQANAGSIVTVILPKESLKASPGFYTALGNRELSVKTSALLLRFYWNLAEAGASLFVHSVTKRLNGAGIAFRMKVLDDRDAYVRCDAGILYVQAEDYSSAAPVLHAVYSDVAGHLMDKVPVFTKRLAPGLALAEDPGTGRSFGLHRCRILAEGILRAHELGRRSQDERLEVVVDHFQSAGVNLCAPYLNPGSVDSYDWI